MLPQTALADPQLDQRIRDAVKGEYSAIPPTDNAVWMLGLSMLLTVGLFVGVWYLLRGARDSIGGGIMSGFSKSGARRYERGDQAVTFDVMASSCRSKLNIIRRNLVCCLFKDFRKDSISVLFLQFNLHTNYSLSPEPRTYLMISIASQGAKLKTVINNL